MAATFTYKVKNLKADPNDDNYVFEATVDIFGTEGDVTKSTSCHCVFPGKKADVTDFKSLDDLKKVDGEATVVDWVKAGWTDYKVKKLEGFVQAAIDKHNSKATETEVATTDTSYSAAPTVTPDPSTDAE